MISFLYQSYDWWLEDMYLKNKAPLPVNSNPGMVLPEMKFESENAWITQNAVRHACKYDVIHYIMIHRFSGKLVAEVMKYKRNLDEYVIVCACMVLSLTSSVPHHYHSPSSHYALRLFGIDAGLMHKLVFHVLFRMCIVHLSPQLLYCSIHISSGHSWFCTHHQNCIHRVTVRNNYSST